MAILTTDEIKNLLFKRLPPKTHIVDGKEIFDENDPQTIFSSVLVALSERIDNVAVLVGELVVGTERTDHVLQQIGQALNLGTSDKAPPGASPTSAGAPTGRPAGGKAPDMPPPDHSDLTEEELASAPINAGPQRVQKVGGPVQGQKATVIATNQPPPPGANGAEPAKQ